MNLFRYLVLFSSILYGLDSADIGYHPFGQSIYALERDFIFNQKKIDPPRPNQLACAKIYIKIDPFHADQNSLENTIAESCNSYSVSAKDRFLIRFENFPKYNGLVMDLEGCNCRTTNTHTEELLYAKDFLLARFDNKNYLLIKTFDHCVQLQDYIEFYDEEKTEITGKEIAEGKQITRMYSRSEAVERKFIDDNFQEGNNWAKISHGTGCLQFYDSFKKSYNFVFSNRETLVSNCYTVNVPEEKGYEIEFSNFPTQESFSVDLTFCDCFTSISTSHHTNPENVDKTNFYLAKLVNNRMTYYYLLVDNNNNQYLSVIDYFKIEDISRQNNVLREGAPTVLRPYRDSFKIYQNFYYSYHVLSWEPDWELKDHSSTCEKIYSTFKLIELRLDINTEKNCGFAIYPKENNYSFYFAEGQKNLDLVKCNCYEGENLLDLDLSNRKISVSTTFYLARKDAGKYYRLAAAPRRLITPEDYVEFV